MPLPTRPGRVENARDAFLCVLSFITLGFWTLALGQICYILIDRQFPDSLAYNADAFSHAAITTQLATLIIAFPLFLFVNRTIALEMRRRQDIADFGFGVRKWLTSVALTIAATILLGDGIWFLTTFLNGELTIRFILKAFVLLFIAGGIFTYYLPQIGADVPDEKRERFYAALASLAVIVGLLPGFLTFGSPAHARMREADHIRVTRLREISSDMHRRWLQSLTSRSAFTLPGKLEDLRENAGANVSREIFTDPETNAPIEYRPSERMAYTLCANFALSSADADRVDSAWKHQAGHQCFNLDASAWEPGGS
jgi:hypothetical protein